MKHERAENMPAILSACGKVSIFYPLRDRKTVLAKKDAKRTMQMIALMRIGSSASEIFLPTSLSICVMIELDSSLVIFLSVRTYFPPLGVIVPLISIKEL